MRSFAPDRTRLLFEFLKRNHVIIALFILSTSFFIYQHYQNVSWDFSVYVSNAKYWAGDGQFYEPQRPPLVPFMLYILSPLGWKAAEYIFIVAVSALFLYSTIRIADALSIDKRLFYLLSLTPYVVFFGLLQGTELLSLALLELFVASVIRKDNLTGVHLGIMCLSRYNFLIFLPLILFLKDWKKIAMSLALFTLVFVPWFAYNFISTGNIFTSIADSYSFNVINWPIPRPFNPYNLLYVASLLLPFALAGMLLVGKDIIKAGTKRIPSTHRTELIIILVTLLAFYQYYKIPIQEIRYVFPLALPVAYFSAVALNRISRRALFKGLVIAIAAVSVSATIGAFYYYTTYPDQDRRYGEALAALESLGIDSCRLKSNEWVFMSYYGKATEVYPDRSVFNSTLHEGIPVLVFYSYDYKDHWINDREFLRQYPVLLENERFMILGVEGRCAPETVVNFRYTNDACAGLFEGKELLNSICRKINLQ